MPGPLIEYAFFVGFSTTTTPVQMAYCAIEYTPKPNYASKDIWMFDNYNVI
jgi:hypothetical protein